jgi:exodeoxyribonuclease VII large subunit
VALLRVPVISSVGHHTDRTLIDDVAAVCASTPTHAAEAAVPIDCRAAHADLVARARRLTRHGNRAIVERARALGHLSRAPRQHVNRHRRQLHQLTRELRASARRACEKGRSLAGVHALVLGRTTARARGADAAKRARELERLALALAAHDPERTLARGYALVQDTGGEPLGTAAAAREASRLRLRFHDGSVPARVDEEDDR